MRHTFLTIALLTISIYVTAQVGGQRSFEFLNIPNTARTVGLGGLNVSSPYEDVNLALSNPALASDSLTGRVSFNYLNYFADTGVLSSAYQFKLPGNYSWFVGVNYIDYGNFESFDATGAYLGAVSASETAISLGASRQAGNFIIGASIKFLSSSIAGFNSTAIVADLGGSFVHPNKSFTAGLVFKNIGAVVSDYSDAGDSSLPFDIQVGTTFKPKYMPFRFTFTGYNLSQGSIAYFDADNVAPDEEEPGTFDRVFRHITVGAELLLSKNINLRAGYNHLVRQELKLEDTAAGAGFSFGLMFRIKAFEFAYSRGGYHAAGGSNSFTLTADTNSFFRKRTI
ncbi:MAG: type IX secretion system protein PorQ [Bacteroidota bacterium]